MLFKAFRILFSVFMVSYLMEFQGDRKRWVRGPMLPALRVHCQLSLGEGGESKILDLNRPWLCVYSLPYEPPRVED